MKSQRSKACDISQKVKMAVWERDNERCILCGTHEAMPNAHYIPRSMGGLGIEENIVTLCMNCHHRLDQTIERKELLSEVKEYLEMIYPNFEDIVKTYKK